MANPNVVWVEMRSDTPAFKVIKRDGFSLRVAHMPNVKLSGAEKAVAFWASDGATGYAYLLSSATLRVQ